MPLVLGVDSSTQSCTVELRDAHVGTLVATASSPHPATNPPVSEQHPEAWWSALRLALADALERSPSGRAFPLLPPDELKRLHPEILEASPEAPKPAAAAEEEPPGATPKPPDDPGAPPGAEKRSGFRLFS